MSRVPGRLRLVAGLVLGATVLLVLGTRISPSAVRRARSGVAGSTLLVAVLLLAGTIPLRALRWSLLFPRSAPLPLRRALAPTAAGLFLNGLLPGRLGDVARVVWVRRREGHPLALSGTIAVLDRAGDALALLGLLTLALTLIPGSAAPESLQHSVRRVTLIVAAMLLVSVPLASGRIRGRLERAVPRRLSAIAVGRIHALIDGIHRGLGVLRSPGRALAAVATSALVWLPQTLANLLLAQSFPLQFSLATACVFTACTVAATLIPSTPGAFGLFEAAGVMALRTTGATTDEPVALAYALTAHVVSYGTVMGLGFVAAWRLGFAGMWSRTPATPTQPGTPTPAA